MKNEKLLKDFFVSNFCGDIICGSQRCDCSEEWVEGCRKYQELKKTVEDKFTELKND